MSSRNKRTAAGPPSDYSTISLSRSLEQLAEQLARTLHDNSCSHRVEPGQNSIRLFPPFEELPKKEQARLHAAAAETLKIIVGLGFQIIDPAGNSGGSRKEESLVIEQQLKSSGSLPVEQILNIWNTRDRDLWAASPSLYLITGKAMLKTGEPLLAYDILSEGIEAMGGDEVHDNLAGQNRVTLVSLLQQQALSLAQTGAPTAGNAILRNLQQLGHSDGETMGMLGRTWKDIAFNAEEREERLNCLEKSFAAYHSAFTEADLQGNLDAAYYTGINAASVSLFAGNREKSRKIAARVQQLCENILAREQDNHASVSFWLHASLGEAFLLQNRVDMAETWYNKAVSGCSNDTAYFAGTA